MLWISKNIIQLSSCVGALYPNAATLIKGRVRSYRARANTVDRARANRDRAHANRDRAHANRHLDAYE
jgi:hypothetical protein